jgi:hypothetical protein
MCVVVWQKARRHKMSGVLLLSGTNTSVASAV